MPVADSSFGWQEAIGAFGIISVVAFLVTWVVTDLGHVSRTLCGDPHADDARPRGRLPRMVGHVVDRPRDGGLGLGLRRRRGRGRGGRAPRPASVLETSSRGSSHLRDGSSGRGSCTEPPRRSCSPPCRCWPSGRRLMHLAGRTPGRRRWFRGARGVGSAVRRGAPSRLPGIPSEGFQEDAAGCARGLRHQATAFLLTGNVLAPILAHIVLHWQLTLRGNGCRRLPLRCPKLARLVTRGSRTPPRGRSS